MEYLHNERNNKKNHLQKWFRVIRLRNQQIYTMKYEWNICVCGITQTNYSRLQLFSYEFSLVFINLLRNFAEHDAGFGFARNTHFVIAYHLFLFTYTNFFSGHVFSEYFFVGLSKTGRARENTYTVPGLRWLARKNIRERSTQLNWLFWLLSCKLTFQTKNIEKNGFIFFSQCRYRYDLLFYAIEKWWLPVRLEQELLCNWRVSFLL